VGPEEPTPAPAPAEDRRDPVPVLAFMSEGLLDGLQGSQRAERLMLLQQLAGEGVPMEELRSHTAQGTLVFLAAERVIAGSGRYTAVEVAERAAVEVGFLLAARRAMGVPVPGPDERLFIEADIEAVRTASLARDAGISEEEMLEVIRTLGRGLSSSAEAMRALALRLVLEPGVGELELARLYARVAAQLAPLVSPLVVNLLTVHLCQVAASEAVSAEDRSAGRLPGSREVSVCFADLVGFTHLGAHVEPHELSQLAMRLEELASEVCEPPVTLVKTIGDAVMLTSVASRPLIEATLALLDLAEAQGEQFPALRAGIATGPALNRAGDWFGSPVNLASRITQIARPGSVLTEGEVCTGESGAYRFSYAGERHLHGVHEPVALYRVRRPEDADR
jgi:adenylate cyclase